MTATPDSSIDDVMSSRAAHYLPTSSPMMTSSNPLKAASQHSLASHPAYSTSCYGFPPGETPGGSMTSGNRGFMGYAGYPGSNGMNGLTSGYPNPLSYGMPFPGSSRLDSMKEDYSSTPVRIVGIPLIFSLMYFH